MNIRLASATAAISALLAVGCATAPSAAPAVSRAAGIAAARPEPADSAGAHRAAMGFLAAFDSLQWEPFRGYLAEDMTMFFPFPQFPARAEGREAVEAVFTRFFEAQRAARTRAGRPLPRRLRAARKAQVGPTSALTRSRGC
jgi:hypothetical protein